MHTKEHSILYNDTYICASDKIQARKRWAYTYCIIAELIQGLFTKAGTVSGKATVNGKVSRS